MMQSLTVSDNEDEWSDDGEQLFNNFNNEDEEAAQTMEELVPFTEKEDEFDFFRNKILIFKEKNIQVLR